MLKLVLSRVFYDCKAMLLIWLNKRRPVSNKVIEGLVISLTTHPQRIPYVHFTIESLLKQTARAEKIYLTLCVKEFPKKEGELPVNLITLLRVYEYVEILWVDEDIRSYLKLVPLRQLHPEKLLVTVDDDIIYEKWMVEKLFSAHKEHSSSIIGCRAKKVQLRRDGTFAPYETWPLAECGSDNIMLTGVGGVLYPPENILKNTYLCDIELFRAAAPTADDVWFWACGLEAGVPAINLGFNRCLENPFARPTKTLSSVNIETGRNDEQIQETIRILKLNST